MSRPKIKVGSYYKFKLNNDHTIAFAVMYGFDSGKNKGVYAIMMYTSKRCFEFPIKKHQFNKWVNEGRVKEINSEEALAYAI